jgi:RND superfamily putative drug exporter
MRTMQLGANGDNSMTNPPRKRGVLARLAGWAYDRRWLVLVGWIVVLVAVTVASQMVGSDYQDKFGGGSTESQRAQDLLQQRFPGRAGDTADIVVRTSPDPVTTPANGQAIQGVLGRIKGLPHVVGIVSPFDQPQSQISQRNGHIAYAIVQFDRQTDDLPTSAIDAVIHAAQSAPAPGLEVELGGAPISKAVFATPGSSEAIGILAAVIILLVAFGSVIAMGLPIVTALFGIGIGFGVISLLSHGLVVPTFGPQLAAMIGIGVGIDYALFIVTRYREGLGEGREPRDAVVRALDTSGRAVLFAGCTVVISLLGMLLLGVSFVYGLAFGSIAAVLLVMSASLSLLPALLGFAGHSIDRLRIPGLHRTPRPGHKTVWYRWSRTVQHHPWIAGGSALVVLLVLAAPVLSLQMLFSDAGNDPTSLTTRRAYDLLAEGFGPGANGPLIVVVDVPAGTPSGAVERVASAVQSTPGIVAVTPPELNGAGDTAMMVAIPSTSPQDGKTESLVHRLRNDVIPAAVAGTGTRALVGGVTAAGIDAASTFSQRLFWVIGGVVGLSFLLLLAVFRSIAVPIKAAIMNLLSIGAAYGVVVAVFQWGWLDGVIGVDKTGPIDPWIPLMLFTILFGLSMDYEVFLLSRIREEWLRTGDNGTAVADGLANTARVITAAAAIMFCVFASFVVGDVRVLKVFGLGLAVAVLIDATIVRLVLVPATMELLGKANWWFPRWLDRIVPHLDVEGEIEAPPTAPVREPVGTRSG